MATTRARCSRRLLAVAIAVALPALARAQEAKPTAIELLTGIDGVGGVLQLPDGTRRAFHIEVTGTRARIVPSRVPKEDVKPIAFGSDEERALLALLDAWEAATFDAEDRAKLLALERLSGPRVEDVEEEYPSFARATLLRTLHAYHRVTRPAIDKVFAGRGTVSLSMHLRLGDDAPRQILWRRLGDQPFARMHVGTDEQPVALDSRDEKAILLGVRYWLAARLANDDVWSVDTKDARDDVKLVLGAFRGYLTATSPRLRGSGVIMDRARGGTRMFEISDDRNRVTTVRFDHAEGSATDGRLRDGIGKDAPVVELGSERERELLTMLRAAAALRRAFAREKSGEDGPLRMLEEELAAYEKQFGAKDAKDAKK